MYLYHASGPYTSTSKLPVNGYLPIGGGSRSRSRSSSGSCVVVPRAKGTQEPGVHTIRLNTLGLIFICLTPDSYWLFIITAGPGYLWSRSPPGNAWKGKSWKREKEEKRAWRWKFIESRVRSIKLLVSSLTPVYDCSSGERVQPWMVSTYKLWSLQIYDSISFVNDCGN